MAWNDTRQDYPRDKCIHELFEQQAEERPDAIAVVFEDQQLSYRQLNERANRLARYLQRQGVGADVRVGICMARSLDLIVGLLGIVKSGGAYVPLELSYPQERLEFVLADAQVASLITQEELLEAEGLRMDGSAGQFSRFDPRIPRLCLDRDWQLIAKESAANLENITKVDNLAYVIYTSGSTGQPKGVAIEHRNTVAFLSWAHGAFTRQELSGVLASTSICFDLSVFEIFAPLTCGGTVIMAENALALVTISTRSKVSLLNTVPSAINELLRLGAVPASVRVINLGGELVRTDLVRRIYESTEAGKVHDLYGPSECTTYSTWTCRSADGPQTIGRPIANTQVYILDDRRHAVPIGVVGEIYIGGDGVARGYLNRPELTAERFIYHSFDGAPERRLYRTGDLARYLPDGNIEFLGRIDNQVKIRGYRIELGEIESVLGQHPAIQEAVVLAREDSPGDRRLVAYSVAMGGDAPSARDLRGFLHHKLPEFMVPSVFMFLDALPLTPNGKLDRKALPVPDQRRPELEAVFVPPRNALEELLVNLWSEVLRVERIGVHDNFFELGGHSLLATQVISRIRGALQVEMPLRTFFETPTVAGFAERIEKTVRQEPGQAITQIVPVARAQEIPLSFAQQRLWFLDQLEPGNAVYNIPNGMRLAGVLDVSALEQSLQEIVNRHEALRTTVATVDGKPVQVIGATLKLTLAVVDLSDTAAAEREAQARRFAEEEGRRSFDLSRGPLFRACLLRLAYDNQILLLTLHHIVADGWSMEVLYRELSALYEAFSTGKPSPLAPLPIQYGDFAVWQKQWLQGETLASQLDYWRQQLAEVPLLQFPTDRPRPALQSYRGERLSIALSEQLTDQLKVLSRKQNATMYMTLLAAFQTLIHRYTGEDDIVVGSPIANRNRHELETLIGFFINTLVVRCDLSGNPSFTQLLPRVREVALGAYAHQDLPFEKLVEELQPERDLSRTPFFQVFFNMLQFDTGVLHLAGLEITPFATGGAESKFDLTMYVIEEGPTIRLTVDYNADLFESKTIGAILSYYNTLLHGIVKNPDRPISSYALLSREQRGRVANRGNPRAPGEAFVEFTKAAIEQSICARFEQQVRSFPAKLAVKSPAHRWSYAELNRQANRIAHTLLRHCGHGGQRVALLFDHGAPMIAAMLGVLKSANAYVPLDPSHPQERIAFMGEDCQAAMLLTDRENYPRALSFGNENRPVVNVDAIDVATSTEDPAVAVSPDALTYVLYTSGSTGQPKGVMQNHRNVLHHIRCYTNNLHIAADDKLTLLSSYGFDAAVMDILAAVLNGATLYPLDLKAQDSAAARRWMIEEAVTIYHSTPTVYRYLFAGRDNRDDLAAIRLVVLGGEEAQSVDFELFKTHCSKDCVLVNGLGPTESTLALQYFMTHETQLAGHRLPVGYPVDDTEVVLLDGAGFDAGVYGEIGIRSAHVALGYWQRPELSDAAFRVDTQGGPRRLYRTGDIGRRLPDGSIGFLGRRDFQVKVRGFRVELGEIEAALGQHPAVRSSVVLVREDRAGEKQLTGYVVGDNCVPAASDLRAHLKAKLPDYMVPSAFIVLEHLPLTRNGKIDRNALPAPDRGRSELDDAFVAPRTAVEEGLASNWAEVLKLDRVGIHDNFFHLGGHSLLATQVMSRVRKIFNCNLPLRSLFDNPTIAELAETIQASRDSHGFQPIAPASRNNDNRMSFAQQRLWFLDRLNPDSSTYNLANAIRLHGELDVVALERGLNEVIRRHEGLRTVFRDVRGSPAQSILPSLSISLTAIDLNEEPQKDCESTLDRLLQEAAQRPFDLSRGPLIRARLWRLAPLEHVLFLNVHHIVSDGWSMGIMFTELAELYAAYRGGAPCALADPPIRYRDFAVWQRDWLVGEELERQLSYWKTQLENLLALQLPIDRPRPAMQTYHGSSQSVELSAHLANAIKTIGQREGVTLFMILLAAFQSLLCRYCGQDDIAVGTPIAGRNRQETEGVIGFFVNTLVLRSDFSDNPTFRELLRQVRETTLQAYTHQDLPFEKLVEELHPVRNTSISPLFQVMFVLENARSVSLRLEGIDAVPVPIANHVAKFDLSLVIGEKDGALLTSLDYNTDLFEARTIERMLKHFQTLLEGVVANPDRRIGELPLVSEAEKHRLLIEWNDTERDYPADKCMHELFEAQVERAPEAIAVVFQDQQLTYRELNTRANQLAHYLRKLGVGPDALVAICLDRSMEMIVGLLGILKAGGAYVPLDPDYPKERLDFMIHDAQIQVLLTQQRKLARLPDRSAQVLCLDKDREKFDQECGSNPPVGAKSQDLACVIYTSGTTGTPKGVKIEHRSLVNYLCWFNESPLATISQHVPAIAKLIFDASLKQLFAPLIGSHPVWIPSADTLNEPVALLEALTTRTQVGLNCVPSLWRALLDELSPARADALRNSLSALFLGGEALDGALIDRTRSALPEIGIWNLYGPTEATANACVGRVTPNGAVTIGRPIANTQIYLLDRYLQPVPIGVAGEIHIGGAGLARGYLNRPDLTQKTFIANPFSGDPSSRIFKTGDLARYLPDGNLEYLGRMDNQVKIRGYRVELGEIEAVLGRHGAIQQAVVLAREDNPGDRRLAAYIVATPGSTPATSELRSYLQQKLPDHMVPSTFMFMASLPLTANGKLDRKALPAPDPTRPELNEAFTPPRTPVEGILASIWAEVLKLDKVGIHDNFFDLGGHSLLATQVVSRIRNAFSIEFPLRSLFELPTVGGMAEMIEQKVTMPISDPELELAQMLREVEAMTESDAEKVLADKGLRGTGEI